MYVGTHSNSYLASQSIARGQAISVMGKNAYGQKIYSSVPSGRSTVANNASTSYLSALKTGGSDMKSALANLTSGSAFRSTGAVSSNKDILTVTQSGKDKGQVSDKDYEIKVQQLAQGQVNEGEALNAGAQVGKDGYYKFAVEIDGKSTELSFSVSSRDTNYTMQEKMAKAINDADLGVKASVDTEKGKSSLNLESKDTGDNSKNVFRLTDVVGNAVEKMGANNTTQEAKDAIYYVNGDRKTSASNTIELDGGIKATLKKASDETVKISQGVDSSAAISAVQKFADAYNKVFNAAFSNDNDSRANVLIGEMTNIARAYSKSLSDIGINFNSNGNMVIDKDTMEKAAESGKLESFFTENANNNYGFTNQIGRVAANIETNVTKYAGEETFIEASGATEQSSDAAAYKSLFASQGLGSAWNIANMNVGMLFNFMF